MKNSKRSLGNIGLTKTAKALGIHFSYNSKENIKQNFEKRLVNMQSSLNIWKSRDLTITGRILLSKSFGISKLLYAASMTTVPNYIIAEGSKIIRDFIWAGRKPKLKWKTLTNSYLDGGLQAPDIACQIKSLRCAWIGRLLDKSESAWKHIPLKFFSKYGGLSFLLNCNSDTSNWSGLGKFYKEMIDFWQELKPEPNPCDQILWNNKHVTINGKSLFYKSWYENGMVYVKDIVNEEGKILLCIQLNAKFNLNINALDYTSIINAIPNTWKEWMQVYVQHVNFDERNFQCTNFTIEGNSIDVRKAKCRDYYWYFIKKGGEPATANDNWERKGYKVGIIQAFLKAKQLTQNRRLLQFYYFFVHRVVCTRQYLYSIKVKDVLNENCLYCGVCDTIEHAFVQCKCSLRLWCDLQKWFRKNFNRILTLSCHQIFLLNGKSDLENSVRLIILYYIYKCRLEKKRLCLHGAIAELKEAMTFEYISAKNSNRLLSFEKKWTFLYKIVDYETLETL